MFIRKIPLYDMPQIYNHNAIQISFLVGLKNNIKFYHLSKSICSVVAFEKCYLKLKTLSAKN